MKLLLAQPSLSRFQWELEVLLTNLKQFGGFEVILLFNKSKDYNGTVPPLLTQKYGAQCFVYPDLRTDRRYIPAVRPYLLWQHFLAHPEAEAEQYFYIDSDIIFREWPDFATCPFDPNMVYGADVGSYLNYDYIKQCHRGPEIAIKMAELCGITVEQMKAVPGIGAQLVLSSTTAAFWERSYHNSVDLYNYLLGVTTNLQKWTAEMWAQQWGWVREGKTLVASPELAFSRPTDPIAKWDESKIMHNAGVTGSGDMFFKGEWVDKLPFGADFSNIDPNKVSAKYVEAIQKVLH